MSILSTSSRLIKVGQEYSAGSGISIDDYIISVTGEFGKTYSAGDNINIYEQDEQLYISSKDWSDDIANASANAYNEATAQIPAPFDPSYISGKIDDKLDTTAFTAWQSGQYATDLQTVEGQINNKLDTSSFSAVSGSFLTAINIPESATWNEVSQVYEQASGTYLTSVSIPESSTWNDVSTTVQSNSAQWSDNTGDEEVNSFVYDNSATINDVNTSYQTNSGDFLTAAPADMATTGDLSDLAQSISETYQVKGDYLTTADSANFYPSNNPSGFITGVDLTNYYQKNETSSKEEISAAIASIPVGDPEVNSFVESNSASLTEASNCVESNSGAWFDNVGDAEVNSFVYNNSATIVDVDTTYQANSGTYLTSHQDISNKLDTTAFSTVSGDFLTTSFGISESAKWEEATTAYEQNSGTYLTAHQDISDLMPKSESANFYPMTGNPSGFLTAHQDLSDYQTIAGMTAYQPVGNYYSASNPSGFITGVDLTPYATTAEVDTLSSFLSGAIDYVSANAGGVISSYTTSWSDNVPPYGNNVINSLNGLYISSFVSNSAGTANNATNANSALSAGYAQTVNVNYVENEGFVRNLSSEYGTIYVTHNNLIDSTNSAISRTGYEGFVSSYDNYSQIEPQATAHYSWNESLPNNKFTIGLGWVSYYSTLFYSANTNLTGQIQLPQGGEQTYSFDIPNATSLDIWCTNYVAVDNAVASAADTFETVVGELAWASALPSYEYNSTNKISAINGSAIAAGDEFPASANDAITAYQTNSGTYLTAISIPDSATWNDVSTTVQTNSADWASHQDLSYISGVVDNKLDESAFANVSGTFLTAVDLTPYQTTAGMVDYAKASAVDDKLDTTAFSTVSADLISVSSTVNSNSASWAGGGGGGGSYTSPNNTIWISADNIESTDSAYIPSHPEDVLLTAISSWSSINGYRTLNNTNKVYFWPDSNRASAFDNEGTFLNSSNNAPAWAETQYPPIKLYTTQWVSVKYSAYSAGIMDAYVVELARKNDVNSALNKKLDSTAFTGYYPSNNPSGFAKATDVVLQSGVNLFDGKVIGINNQYLMGCDSAYNYTLVGTSAATASLTASAYVGTGHPGVTLHVSSRQSSQVNWTAFGEDGSNLSAGQLYLTAWGIQPPPKDLNFISPLAENISGVKLYGNNYNTTTAYSAYTSDVKQLASQSNITFLSGAIDYVSANAGGGGSVTLPITGTDGDQDMTLDEYGLHIGIPEGGYNTTLADYGTYISMTQTDSDNTMSIGPGYIEIGDSTSTALINAQSIRDWNSVSSTVNSNSATWNSVSSKQDTLTFGYDGQDKISAINNSAIAGAGSLDIVPISGTGSVNVYEQSNVLWVSGKDFTSDINYISGVVGDVETLLASL